jgi:hypothetical protein
MSSFHSFSQGNMCFRENWTFCMMSFRISVRWCYTGNQTEKNHPVTTSGLFSENLQF